MKYTCVIFALLVAAVNCQTNRGPPPPPPSGQSVELKPSPVVTLPAAQPQAQPQPQLQAMPQPQPQPQSNPQPMTSSRPAGCSPGCYAEEICAALGRSYCARGGQCHVCIKMSSIRFPASALSGMFAGPAVAPQPAVQPAIVPQARPGQNQFGYATQQTANPFGFMSQRRSNQFSYAPQTPAVSSMYPYYNPQPQQNQFSSSSWGSSSNMFPFLFMGDFGFGF